jgi:hypothetical protein
MAALVSSYFVPECFLFGRAMPTQIYVDGRKGSKLYLWIL